MTAHRLYPCLSEHVRPLLLKQRESCWLLSFTQRICHIKAGGAARKFAVEVSEEFLKSKDHKSSLGLWNRLTATPRPHLTQKKTLSLYITSTVVPQQQFEQLQPLLPWAVPFAILFLDFFVPGTREGELMAVRNGFWIELEQNRQFQRWPKVKCS